MFLGTFLSYLPEHCIKVDTEITKEDLNNNIILIGGPRVNAVTAKINKHLPIRFLETKEHYVTGIYSSITNKTYSEEEGMVVKTKNPFSKKKEILVIGGKGRQGTKAALLAFLQNFDELCKGNSYDRKILARVVEGIDTNSDGVVDSMEFIE